jgi:hypothetical protein
MDKKGCYIHKVKKAYYIYRNVEERKLEQKYYVGGRELA